MIYSNEAISLSLEAKEILFTVTTSVQLQASSAQDSAMTVRTLPAFLKPFFDGLLRW
jgi:hypothetical protein